MNDESKRFRDSMYMGSGSQDNIIRSNGEEFGRNSDARRSRPRSTAEHQYNAVRGSARRAKRAQDKAKREAKVKSKIISKILIVAIFLGLAFWILKVAPNYINEDIVDKANIVINNSNVTADLKKDIIIENNVIIRYRRYRDV